MNDNCPQCGAKIRLIPSVNGSDIPVDYAYVSVWVSSDDKKAGLYLNKIGFLSHHKTCKSKNRKSK